MYEIWYDIQTDYLYQDMKFPTPHYLISLPEQVIAAAIFDFESKDTC
ncbi:hypothetical protein ES708_21249 [subsurface metagenome]